MDDIDKILRIIEAVKKTEDTKYDKLVDEVKRLSDKVDMLVNRQCPIIIDNPPMWSPPYYHDRVTCGMTTGGAEGE